MNDNGAFVYETTATTTTTTTTTTRAAIASAGESVVRVTIKILDVKL